MSLTVEETKQITEKYGKSGSDTGSSKVQIALLTERLGRLNEHFKTHKHDNHSRRGLLLMVGQRKRMLRYLHSRDAEGYRSLIADLGIRK